ncbi:MAG: SIS domain-containing protein [Janthinobacterium lividum]
MGEDSGTQRTTAFSGYAAKYPEAAALLDASAARCERLGYGHTLLEILQQPETWVETAGRTMRHADELTSLLDGCCFVVLTGSGSSQYAGECVRTPLQTSLLIPVQTMGSGALLTGGSTLLPTGSPSLMVSFARSGDSPESVGAMLVAQGLRPGMRHLIVTCNKDGKLVTSFAGQQNVAIVVLDERTNDKSLVMTSSFTNMVLAATGLNFLHQPERFLKLAQSLGACAAGLLRQAFGRLPAFLAERFDRAFYLASPSLLGAARESALKLTEMTSGRVLAVCETYLGLRHGPMSAVHPRSLVVCYLSADPLVRAYELDVIRELKSKRLGMKKLLVGHGIPTDVAGPDDLILDHAGLDDDAVTSVLYVVVGQVLALLRCLEEGLRPDAPSEDGVINRVVSNFRMYGSATAVSV